LEIEVTESALLCNEEAVLAALHRLHAMDVRVAMDDFGTGYSSLSQLNSFPFNKIKIDRSCVLEGSAAAVQNAVIRAISALATSLSIDTVAEGVETADQLSRIRADGCTLAQGFLISRPVPAGQIAAVISELATRQCGGHSANARD
jgi:EAL domain-containing protein (putative c-di-GMP-specific phosphodiesterase class I)